MIYVKIFETPEAAAVPPAVLKTVLFFCTGLQPIVLLHWRRTSVHHLIIQQ